ncbi:acyl-CoA binding domain-containing protein 6 [Mortierella sp. AD011]|nr:acyl-CoA binding domain-containing protein 6 [Mortierella sp. AD010]KAF9403171.1 acyl-CoA binding domain-containing protein 6 [Mortierella sp. AD011]
MLEDRFKNAAAYMASKKNLNLPSSTKLALYADYKIATEGQCTQPRPSLIEFEKSAKWKAWKETGDRYMKELDAAKNSSASSDLQDIAQLTLSTKAMISYVQRVGDGQWGWTFDAADSAANSGGSIPTTGDQDLDELEAYLGVDKDEISAEELLARPYVPIQGHMEGATMTASGISTLASQTEDDAEDDPFASAKGGSLESLQAALAANPDIASLKDDAASSSLDSPGFTMLHWVCDRGSLEKAKLLVETYNVNINAQDTEGSTPLHYACLSGWPQIVAYLKSVPGIDLTIKDNSGMTADECME